MPGLFPNPSAAPENFKIGDQVRWFVNEQAISPYVGRVTEICPGTHKVWVEWPVGGNQQMDPEVLILVPPTEGLSPITEESGYSSYEKQKSKEQYGTLSDKVAKMAQKVLSSTAKEDITSYKTIKQAKSVSEKFAAEVVSKVAGDVIQCKQKELTDLQAYNRIYPKYANICSDSFIKKTIHTIYEVES